MRMSGKVWSGMVCGLVMASVVLASGLNSADARPLYLPQFKDTYPKVADLADKAKCGVCHVGMPMNKEWNHYGMALGKAFGDKTNVKKREEIKEALVKIEKEKAANGKTFKELLDDGKLPAEETAVSE